MANSSSLRGKKPTREQQAQVVKRQNDTRNKALSPAKPTATYNFTNPESPKPYTPSPTTPSPQPSHTGSRGVTFASKLRGDELRANAVKRREERLRDLGLTPDSELRKLLEEGATYNTTSVDGKPVFRRKDGSLFVLEGEPDAVERAGKFGETTVEGMENEIMNEQNQQAKHERDTMLQKQGETPTAIEKTPEQAGMDAALQNLPPEAQFLAPFLQSIQSGVESDLTANTDLAKTLMQGGTFNGMQIQGIQPTFKAIENKMTDLETGYRTTAEAVQGLIQTVREDTQRELTVQKNAEAERLAWEKSKAERELNRKKRETHESLVVQFALAGGFGQDAAMREVREADALYDQKIMDLQTEFGVQNTELAAKYSAMYVEANNTYMQKSAENMQTFMDRMEKLGLQSISSIQAKQKAEQDLATSTWENEVGLRKDYANTLQKVAFELNDLVIQERKDKAEEQRRKEDREWDSYKFHRQLAVQADNRLDQFEDRLDARAQKRDDKERYNAQQEIDRIRRGMEGSRVIDQYKDARMLWENLDTGYQEWQNDKNAFSDRDMVKAYEKLVEIGSVVMPSEYADIRQSAPLLNKVEGKFNRILSNEPGIGLTDQDRKQLHDIGNSLFNNYQKRYNEEAQQFYSTIDFHNRNTENPSYHISPLDVGLPKKTTSRDRSRLDSLEQGLPDDVRPGNPFTGTPTSMNLPPPKLSGFSHNDFSSLSLGGRSVTGQKALIARLEAANAAFFRDKGKHIQVNSHFRSREQQEHLHRTLSAKGARVAKPGTSFHEKGLAIDVTNWQEAEPYLRRFGLLNGLKGDMGHFSIGELDNLYAQTSPRV